MRRSPTVPGEGERFLREVALPFVGDDCLIWPHSRTKQGYGVVTVGGVRTSAHRAICIMAHGEPPSPEHEAAHSCGKGHLGCIHPHHVRWATPKENSADMVLHGTSVRGERNAAAILTKDQVREIFALKGKVRQIEIAHYFEVSQATVADIHRGGAWGWLTGASLGVGHTRGSAHHASRLSESDARAILAARGRPRVEVAERFNVTPQAIGAIWSGRTWAWLSESAA